MNAVCRSCTSFQRKECPGMANLTAAAAAEKCSQCHGAVGDDDDPVTPVLATREELREALREMVLLFQSRTKKSGTRVPCNCSGRFTCSPCLAIAQARGILAKG